MLLVVFLHAYGAAAWSCEGRGEWRRRRNLGWLEWGEGVSAPSATADT